MDEIVIDEIKASVGFDGRRRLFVAPALIIILASIVGSTAGRTEGRQLVPASPGFAVTTDYLEIPVGTARRIEIKGRLGSRGTVALDPNSCRFDRASGHYACTTMAWKIIDVAFRERTVGKSAGQHKRGRKVYDVVGDLPVKLRLCAGSSRQRPDRLLVLGPSGQVVRTVQLKPLRSSPG